MSNSKISFDVINKEVENMMKEVKPQSVKRIIDENGVLITFPSHRDYMSYLDERDWRVLARN